MPVSQSEFTEDHGEGRSGQVARISTFDADSVVVAHAAGIPFGVAVGGTIDNGVLRAGLPVAANTFIGLSVIDPRRDPSEENSYANGAHATIAYRGDIYVEVEGPVAFGDDVRLRASNGALSHLRIEAAWAAAVAYNVGDFVTVSGDEYECITAHTSTNGDTAGGDPTQGNAENWSGVIVDNRRIVPGARFIKAASAGDVAIVRLSGIQWRTTAL